MNNTIIFFLCFYSAFTILFWIGAVIGSSKKQKIDWWDLAATLLAPIMFPFVCGVIAQRLSEK